jgi:RimJ/RimL family protein N-acetyltransferase
LRAIREEDAPLLAAIDADPGCQRWFDFPTDEVGADEALDHARSVIDRWRADVRVGTRFPYVLELEAGQLPIGTCELQVRDDVGSISYAVLPPHRGHGFATEATRALRDAAFDHFGLERVELRCDPENVASRRVAEKAGFELAAVERGAVTIEWYRPLIGTKRDALVFVCRPPVHPPPGSA